MNTPYDQDITPSSSSYSLKSKNFGKNSGREHQRESLGSKVVLNNPISLKEESSPFSWEKRNPSNYIPYSTMSSLLLCLVPCEIGRILVFEKNVDKFFCKKLCLWTLYELDFLILNCFSYLNEMP